MLDSELDRRLDVGRQCAHDAGKRTLRYFQQPTLDFERKSDNSPVTIADKEAELFLRERLLGAFPQDGFVGEEFGEVAGTSGFRWVADPIDGTKSFISGVPLYSTLLGLLWHDQSVAGVIEVPALDESISAARGRGATWRKGSIEQPARVSERSSLADAIFTTSQVDSFARREAANVFEALQKAAYVTRTWGDGYGYLLLATGRVDIMVDPFMNLWDAAAIQPVIEEAGGVFSSWSGVPTIHAGEGLATNARLFSVVVEITRPFAMHER